MKASTILAVIFLGALLAAVILSLSLPFKARVGPLLVGIPGVILCLLLIFRESFAKKQESGEAQSSARVGGVVVRLKEFWSSYSEIALSLAGFLTAIFLVGLIPGICLSIFAYLKLTRHGWLMSVVQGIIAFVLLYGVFHLLMGVTFYKGVLFE